ncbi:MAG TPA: helix-turn-helix domain-containing protein [Vicinamibacterales bacterium]|jgi:cytoskeletal protein RodZ|nr:helix-turn-helix domain-containing protein [Vicinamibacterales bacterium]
MPELAALLRGAREDAGLSRQELAARTKIRVSTLEAMERGEFDRLPRGVFMRGFLRACARELNLDPEAVVASYSLETIVHPAPAPPLAQPDPLLAEPNAIRRYWRPLAAGVAFLLFVSFLARVRPDPASDAVVPRPVATTGVEAARNAKSSPTPRVASAPPRADGVEVAIRAARPLWLEATADGQQRVYRLMNAGERETIAARSEVRLRVGDAAAMQYSIDGRPGRPLGPSGAVRNVRITPANAKTFLP